MQSLTKSSKWKYFLSGGRVNYEMLNFIKQDEEIKDYLKSKQYMLDIVDFYMFRNMILNKSVNSNIITHKEAIEKCGTKESLFGYHWIKSIVEDALKIEITLVDNF